jgi:hypothetical protein
MPPPLLPPPADRPARQPPPAAAAVALVVIMIVMVVYVDDMKKKKKNNNNKNNTKMIMKLSNKPSPAEGIVTRMGRDSAPPRCGDQDGGSGRSLAGCGVVRQSSCPGEGLRGRANAHM